MSEKDKDVVRRDLIARFNKCSNEALECLQEAKVLGEDKTLDFTSKFHQLTDVDTQLNALEQAAEEVKFWWLGKEFQKENFFDADIEEMKKKCAISKIKAKEPIRQDTEPK